MRSLKFLLTVAIFLIPLSVYAQDAKKVEILLLGDSTTEAIIPKQLNPDGPHFEHYIEKLLATDPTLPPVHVTNTGLSGETIHRLVSSGRYKKIQSSTPHADYIFFRYGLNDLARREDFAKNFPADIHDLIAQLRRDYPKAVIIPMTVIPYSGEEKSNQINSIIKDVAAKEGLEVFDVYPAYEKALLAQGINSLNYRRYAVDKVPAELLPLAERHIRNGSIVIEGNELDAFFGHLPGWYSDRHPNQAGYNVLAVETANYLKTRLPKVSKEAK